MIVVAKCSIQHSSIQFGRICFFFAKN